MNRKAFCWALLLLSIVLCISFADGLNLDETREQAVVLEADPAPVTQMNSETAAASATDLWWWWMMASPTDLWPASATDLWQMMASSTDLWPASATDLWGVMASQTDLWPASATDLWGVMASQTDLWPASATDMWEMMASQTDLWPASTTDLWGMMASQTDLWPVSATDLAPSSPTDLWLVSPTDLDAMTEIPKVADFLTGIEIPGETNAFSSLEEAAAAFRQEEATPAFQDDEDEDGLFLEKPIEQDFTDLKVGDVIRMGYYEQDGDLSNLREPIEWQVISVNRRKDVALVTTVYALDSVPFGTAGNEAEYREPGFNWKNSAIRQWLNDEIYAKCFTSAEQQRIRQATNITKDPSGRFTTQDYVFLLSRTETGRYFGTAKKLKCEPTPYALSRLSESSSAVRKDGTCRWWVRELTHAVKVNKRGEAVGVDHNEAGYVDGSKGMATFIRKIGALTYEEDAALVRPAMWIRYDKAMD